MTQPNFCAHCGRGFDHRAAFPPVQLDYGRHNFRVHVRCAQDFRNRKELDRFNAAMSVTNSNEKRKLDKKSGTLLEAYGGVLVN